MSWIDTDPTATSRQQDQTQALNTLLSQINDDRGLHATPWDGFAIVLTGVQHDGQTSLHQLDAILYTPGEGPGHATLSRHGLEATAVAFFDAMAGDADFDLAIAILTYRRDTRALRTDLFWDHDASPYIIDPRTWHIVAAALDPFRP